MYYNYATFTVCVSLLSKLQWSTLLLYLLITWNYTISLPCCSKVNKQMFCNFCLCYTHHLSSKNGIYFQKIVMFSGNARVGFPRVRSMSRVYCGGQRQLPGGWPPGMHFLRCRMFWQTFKRKHAVNRL